MKIVATIGATICLFWLAFAIHPAAGILLLCIALVIVAIAIEQHEAQERPRRELRKIIDAKYGEGAFDAEMALIKAKVAQSQMSKKKTMITTDEVIIALQGAETKLKKG